MKIKDYQDAMEFFRTNDYQAADGAWSEFYQSEVLEPRIMDLADGGRIGFKDGLSVDLYNSLYDEYAELIEQGIKNEKLIDIPSWDKYIKSKNVSPVSLKYYAGGEGIRINPTELLQNKKIELAEKIIERENEKLDGAFKRGKNPPKGKLHVAELFRNKVVGPSWSLGGKHKGMNTLLNNLINTKLDTRADKIKKAFNLVTSPEYELNTGIRNEIAELMGESKDMFDAGKLKSPYGPNPNEVWEELIKPYEYVDEKTGKTKNLLKTLNLKINKLPKGTDTTFSYLLEVVENDRLGKAGIEDWWKMAGDKPEQWAMRQIDRAWKNNDPRLKVYDLNGKPITWEAGKKISSDKILFEYVDEDFPQYKNKLYSFYKPKKTTGLNYPVYDLSTQIRTLPEWEELVEVVDGKNKLKTTEMINPFTGDKSTYQKVYEDIYKRINTTAYGTKEGYSKIKSMAGQIDHDFGQAKGLFNNLRLSTGQQNLMFKTLADAAATNPDLEPYVRALESEMYTGGSIDDQIKAIVNETNELGKVVKNAPGKITIPTATETAAYKFLKNEIPGLPESVIKYLQPKAAIAESTIKVNPNILNAFCSSTRKKFATAGVVDGLVCSMDEIQENIKKQTNQAMKATKDGKVPKKFGKLRSLAKFFGWVDAPIEFFFAAPHLIAGDIEGAKRATTLGLGGWGKIDLDNISDEKAQRYLKHTQAMNNYLDNYGRAITTEKALENLTPGTGAHDLMNNQFERAKTNMDKIQEDYQSYGYTYQDGDIPMKDKVATQNYIRDKVKSDFEKKIENIASNETFQDADQELLKEQLRDLGGRPEKVTPITDLESYIKNKGEEMAGNTNWFFNVKPYVLEEAEAHGVPEIFDDYALGAGVEGPGRKSLQDAYSEIPIEYANQLAALEKKQLEEGLKERRIEKLLENQYFSQGGIASLKRK